MKVDIRVRVLLWLLRAWFLAERSKKAHQKEQIKAETKVKMITMLTLIVANSSNNEGFENSIFRERSKKAPKEDQNKADTKGLRRPKSRTTENQTSPKESHIKVSMISANMTKNNKKPKVKRTCGQKQVKLRSA